MCNAGRLHLPLASAWCAPKQAMQVSLSVQAENHVTCTRRSSLEVCSCRASTSGPAGQVQSLQQASVILIWEGSCSNVSVKELVGVLGTCLVADSAPD